MNKRITAGVISAVVAVGVVMAGGDTAKDAKASEVVGKAPVTVQGTAPDPVPQVVDCKDCPVKVVKVIKYVDVPVKPRTEWFAAGSALYLDGAGLGAGVGYKFRNGVMVVGQAAYLQRHGGTDDVTFCRRTVQGYRPEDAWGGIATVLIPLGRR